MKARHLLSSLLALGIQWFYLFLLSFSSSALLSAVLLVSAVIEGATAFNVFEYVQHRRLAVLYLVSVLLRAMVGYWYMTQVLQFC